MNDTLKFIWAGLMIFCVLGLLVSVPVEKAQRQVKRAMLKKQLAPQARLDAVKRYLEDYEDGKIDEVYSFGDSPELKTLYDIELNKKVSEYDENSQNQPAIRRPLYIRDRKNPNILYKYTYEGEYKTDKIRKFQYKKLSNFPNNVRRPLYIRDRNNPNIYYPVYP